MKDITISLLRPEHFDDAATIMARAYRFFDYPIRVVAWEKLFGQTPHKTPWFIGAFRGPTLVGVAAGADMYIRILAVHPDEQQQGIGAVLLREIERLLSRAHSRICIAAEPGNYLTPGIDCRDTQTIRWLFRRGFKRTRTNQNVTVDISSVEPLRHEASRRAEELAAKGYCIGPNDINVLDQFEKNWSDEKKISPVTLFEAHRGLLFSARSRQSIVAFAAYNANNRGLWSFGPMMTAPEHQYQGLGSTLLILALEDIAYRANLLEKPHIDIPWVGPLEFYTRLVPVLQIQSFAVFERALS